jgi:tetratricopeptide (TPR) repeat protein
MKRLVFLLLGIAMAFSGCQFFEKKEHPSTELTKTDAIDTATVGGITQAIAKDSLNPDLYLKRAMIYEANEDYGNAIKDMYKAMMLDSNFIPYYKYTAELMAKSGDPLRAIAFLERAARMDTTDAEIYAMMGKYRYIMKDYERAQLLYAKALTVDKFNPTVHFLRGVTYKEMGDTAKAIFAFQTAVEQDPNYYEAYIQLNGLLTARNNKTLARKYLDNAIKVKPRSEEALYAKGYALINDKQYAEAVQVLRQLVEINHQHDEALYALGVAYLMQDSIEEADKMFSLAIQVNPTYAEAHYKKGVCREALGKKAEAKMYYSNALNLKPDYKPAQDAYNRIQ